MIDLPVPEDKMTLSSNDRELAGRDVFVGILMAKVLCMACEKWGVKVEDVVYSSKDAAFEKTLQLSNLEMLV